MNSAHFVIPFCIGTGLMLVFLVWKYCRWIRSFSKRQHAVVIRNLLSWKILPAIWEAFREGLLHWRITQKNRLLGYMHRSLAFGWFLLIAAGALQAALFFPDGHAFYMAIFLNFFEPRTPGYGQTLPPAPMADLMDALLLYVFSGLLLAMFKKVWSRPLGMKRTTKHGLIDRAAKCTLWAIFPLRAVSEGLTSALYGNGGFLIRAIGGWFSSAGIASIHTEYTAWMLYSLDVGLFFSLMPFTRYMHIFTEVFLIYFRQLGVRESAQKSGYTMFELNACARCGICIDNCPINKDLHISDTQSVDLIKALRNKDVFRKAADIADNCMMCGRCAEECPVKIDLGAIRRQVRASSNKPIDAKDCYGYLRDIHPFNAIGRVAYFGGCMSKLTPGITESMIRIFEAAQQPYWYMDREQNICCGRPLMLQGFANQADELHNRNTSLIMQSGAKMLVTSCPICYQSFTKEYRLSIPVLHHSEYIAMLIREGRIRVEREEGLRTVYHDPCELGRGCGIYDAPREVVGSAATLIGTQQEREHSLCCGFNLGNTRIDSDQQLLIRNAALENLTQPHPDLIATACPMCKKALVRGGQHQVMDIAEIIAHHLI